MSDYKTLGEVVSGISSGELAEGTVFNNSLGTKAVVSGGSLLWVLENGYVSTPVSITNDTVTDVWALVSNVDLVEVTFTEALDLVAEGTKVTLETVDLERFEVNDLVDLDQIIGGVVDLEVLYYGKAFYEIPKRITAGTINAEKATAISVGKKLERADAHRIHHLKHFVGKTAESIALEFGVSTRMVYYILDGTYWNDVYKEFQADFDVAVEDYIK